MKMGILEVFVIQLLHFLYMRRTLDSAIAIYLINVLEIFNKSGSVNTTQNNLFYDSRHFH